MLAYFQSLAEFFNVILPFSCVAVTSGKRKTHSFVVVGAEQLWPCTWPWHDTVSKHGVILCRMKAVYRSVHCSKPTCLKHSILLAGPTDVWWTVWYCRRWVIRQLPPASTASQRYNLRHRAHARLLPKHSTHLSDCNFLTRMLYKNTY